MTANQTQIKTVNPRTTLIGGLLIVLFAVAFGAFLGLAANRGKAAHAETPATPAATTAPATGPALTGGGTVGFGGGGSIG